MHSRPIERTYAYDAFVSYSRKDIAFARALENALESYTPPKGIPVPQRHLVVFRDEEDFTGGEYHQSLKKHLESSKKMLVICSPHARASQWVDDEIRMFADMRGAGNIIPVLLSGIPNNEADTPAKASQKAFPRYLRQIMPIPLAASFRGIDPIKDKVYKGVYKGPWYKILAEIYGIARSEIEQRERKRKTRRRRLRMGIVTAIIVILTFSLIATLSQRDAAVQARNDAERLIAFMVFDLRDGLRENFGRLDLLSAISQRVIGYYQKISEEKASPQILRQKSVALVNSGDVLLKKGLHDKAMASFRIAEGIGQKLTEFDPDNTRWSRDLAISQSRIGDVLLIKNKPDEALTLFIASKVICEKIHATDPNNAEWMRDLAISHIRIGDVLLKKDLPDEALKAFRASQGICEKLVERDPDCTEWMRDLSVSLFKIGHVLSKRDSQKEALTAFNTAKKIREEIVRKHPGHPEWMHDLALCGLRIGDILANQGLWNQSLTHFQSASHISERLVATQPLHVSWMRDLFLSRINIGKVLLEMGLLEDASQAFTSATDVCIRLSKLPRTTDSTTISAQAWGYLSWYMLFIRQPRKAIEAAREGLQTDPSQTWIKTNLAHGYLLSGQYAQAEKIYREHSAVETADGPGFGQMVLEDFEKFRAKEINHPDMAKIEQIMLSQR